MTSTSNYKKYITGLKGFACVMVMVGHFLGVFAYAESMPIDTHYFLAFRNSKLGFLLNESYWLFLFFIVSGYLLAYSRIDKLHQLFAKMVQRFLRLGLPVLFAYVIIYIIYKAIGFHNGETGTLFENEWYQHAYSGDYSLITVLMAPIDVLILGNCSLNSPYWVLREMFIASLIIYLANYARTKAANIKWINNWLIPIITLGISFILFFFFESKVVTFCVCGAILSWCEKDIDTLKNSQMFYLSILVITLGISLLDKSNMQQLFFLAMIVCVPKIKILNGILSSKVFEFVGDISFGIYSFHCPLYCSIGGLIMVQLTPQTGLFLSIMIAMLSSFVATIIISWMYHVSCERLSGLITKKSYTILCKPFKRT